MTDTFVKTLFKEPDNPPLFDVGQTVRGVSRIDVNMPKELNYWLNSKCRVLQVIPRGFISREWCYELLHENGATCEFKAEELDARFRKRHTGGNTH